MGKLIGNKEFLDNELGVGVSFFADGWEIKLPIEFKYFGLFCWLIEIELN